LAGYSADCLLGAIRANTAVFIDQGVPVFIAMNPPKLDIRHTFTPVTLTFGVILSVLCSGTVSGKIRATQRQL